MVFGEGAELLVFQWTRTKGLMSDNPELENNRTYVSLPVDLDQRSDVPSLGAQKGLRASIGLPVDSDQDLIVRRPVLLLDFQWTRIINSGRPRTRKEAGYCFIAQG